jgi:hypothetical protein
MCEYTINCPYKCIDKFSHCKKYAAMAKNKPYLKPNFTKKIYLKEEQITVSRSKKVNWEVVKEYFK